MSIPSDFRAGPPTGIGDVATAGGNGFVCPAADACQSESGGRAAIPIIRIRRRCVRRQSVASQSAGVTSLTAPRQPDDVMSNMVPSGVRYLIS